MRKERERADGVVFTMPSAFSLLNSARRANGRICASGIDQERHGADSSVEVGIGVAKERVKTECRVICTGGYARKGEVPIRRVTEGLRPGSVSELDRLGIGKNAKQASADRIAINIVF